MRRSVIYCLGALALAGCGVFGPGHTPYRLLSRAPDGTAAERVVVQAGSAVLGARVAYTEGARGIVVALGDPGLNAGTVGRLQRAGFDVARVDAGDVDPAALAGLVEALSQPKRDLTLAGFGPGAPVALKAAQEPGIRVRRLILAGRAPADGHLALTGTDVLVLMPAAVDSVPDPFLVTRIVRQKGCTRNDHSDTAQMQRDVYTCSDSRSVVFQRGGSVPDAIMAALAPPPAPAATPKR